MLLALAGTTALAQALPGIGRAATPKEVAAWDIDVRPDFKGLPKGAGTVSQGQDLWEAKCASCHGIFGESNEFFAPLVGGTTAADVKSGRAARLTDAAYPGRTTLMKLSTVSTLWDYIYRAMPWNAPKSLAPDEVYALTAFLLNLGDVVPQDFELSDRNIAQVQARLPNRNGMTTRHAMWPGKLAGSVAKPDVTAAACMRDCATEPTLASMLPDFARNAHGNLAEQNRMVGAQHGADTTQPAGAAAPAAPTKPAPGAAPTALLTRLACTACHVADRKLIGPSWRDIHGRHGGRSDAQAYLAGKIRSGGVGVWGAIPMPAQSISEEDAKVIARWLAAGAPQ
ncbi:MAG: cytochrome C [Rubrivivax sp. SCN 71-131]|nr:MAG: cytochrome C [Rubrivivax sp. SCN 71-131]